MGKTEICNQALTFLRGSLVSNIDTDQTVEAALCRLFYTDVVQEVLEACDWSFATKRVKLTEPLVETPVNNGVYGVAFSIPDDYLRVVQVEPEWINWTIESNLFLSSETNVFLTYIYDLQDTAHMKALFRRCIALKMAALMAMGVTGNRAMAEMASQEFGNALALAMNRDASESAPFVYSIDDFTKVRL